MVVDCPAPGIDTNYIRSRFRGSVLHNGETDTHLAHVKARETLRFAASTRPIPNLPSGLLSAHVSDMLCDMVMSVFGVSHTANTRVDDEFVRGVSGGEGKASEAVGYFKMLGFERPERQTTPDFLTSMTSPCERVLRHGFDQGDEFADQWIRSKERQALLHEIEEYQE